MTAKKHLEICLNRVLTLSDRLSGSVKVIDHVVTAYKSSARKAFVHQLTLIWLFGKLYTKKPVIVADPKLCFVIH
jgi:hypothetical protein